MSFRAVLMTGTCAFALGLTLSPTAAQDGRADPTAAEPVTTLAPVTTVGTKTAKTFLDTLGSVSVITRDQIETQIPSTLDDLLKHVPGVDTEGSPRGSAEQFNIRGMNSDRIVIRVDGARANFNSGHRGRTFIDPDLLRRVEVVRGPSSIYGSGALGGVIQLETLNATDLLQPGKNFGFRTKIGGFTANDEFLQSQTAFGQYKNKIDLLVNFATRVSSLIKAGPTEPGDSREFVPNSKDRIKSGLVKFNMKPLKNHKLTVSYQVYNNDNYIPTAANTNSTTNIADRITREERYVVGYQFKSERTKLFDFHARVYHNKVKIDETVVDPGTNLGRQDITDFDTVGFDVYNTSRATFFGGVLKSALTYGVEHYKDTQAGVRDGSARQQYPNAEALVTGLYVQSEWTLWDKLTFLGTLRWDNYDQTATDQDGLSASHLSKSFSIGYRPVKWLLVYGKYAEAFRAPNLTELYARGVHFPVFGPFSNNFIPNPNLRPEDAHSFEGGIAVQRRNLIWQGDRLTARVAGYTKKVKDLIDLDVVMDFTTFTFTTQAVNVRDARISGAELEMMYTSRWLFAGLAGAYQIGENLNTGGSLYSVPAQKLMVTLGTRVPDLDILAGVRGTFVSDQNRVPTGNSPTSGYALADVFVSWAPSGKKLPWLKGFRLDAGIDNLFDKRYRRHLSELPEAGRNFKIAVSYTFQFSL